MASSLFELLRAAMTTVPSLRPRRLATVVILWAIAAGVAGAAGLPAEPHAASVPARADKPSSAYDRCEDAVAQAIREMRGAAAQELRFEAASRAEDAQGAELAIRGSGRYLRGGRTPVSFRYSCAYDPESGKTSGVLFHESDGTPPPALPVWHADVSRLALEACEGETAARLQAARPRASGIVFDGGDRRLSPGAEGGTMLEGSGRYAPAAGVAQGAFRYRCEFDAAGRLRDAHAE
jgi:hypothetical protein